ncbi:MAG: hypothetical protein ACOYMS_00195 [Terrimicrobiaceae bacterium]
MAALAAVPLLWHMDKLREYTLIYRNFYPALALLRLEANQNTYPHLFAVLPQRLAQLVVFLDESATMFRYASPLGVVVRFEFWLAILLSVAGVFMAVCKKLRVSDHVLLLMCLFVVLCSVFLFYPADSSNYALYPALVVAGTTTAFLAQGVMAGASQAIRVLSFSVLSLFAVSSIANSLFYLAHARRLAGSGGVASIDAVFEAKELMAESVTAPTSYCDAAGWRVGGARTKSLFYDLANKQSLTERETVRSVVFDPLFLNILITRFPSFSAVPVSPKEQGARLTELLAGTSLHSLLFSERGPTFSPALLTFAPLEKQSISFGPRVFLVDSSRVRMLQTERIMDFTGPAKPITSPGSLFLLVFPPDFPPASGLSEEMRSVLASLNLPDPDPSGIFRIVPQCRLISGSQLTPILQAWNPVERGVDIFQCKVLETLY